MLYISRNYRNKVNTPGLSTYEVKWKESDLFISTTGNLAEAALSSLKKVRAEIEGHIAEYPEFKSRMEPVKITGYRSTYMSEIIKKMADSSGKAGVGPMAAVAGAIAEEVGINLMKLSDEVIVENGGDIFFKITRQKTVAVFAAESPLSMKIGIKLEPCKKPFGMCTSSGSVGHSVSYGNADAVVCKSESAAMADAFATAIGNMVINQDDIDRALKFAGKLDEVSGCLIIFGDKMGAAGNIEICKID